MVCPLLAGMTATCAGARSSKERPRVCVGGGGGGGGGVG